MDRPITPTGLPKTVDLGLRHRAWGAGQLLGILEEGRGRLVETGIAPVLPDPVRQGVIDLCPEVVPVRVDSIVAVVRDGDNDRQHFPLRPGERRGPMHDLDVEPHGG